MTIELVRDLLFMSAVINIALLLWWVLLFTYAHDWLYGFHGRWFSHLTVESFDAIHYAGMTFYKISIFLLNIVPYLALLIVA